MLTSLAVSMMGKLPTIAGSSRLRIKPLVACLALPLAIADFACPSIAMAATLQVTNCNDAGSGSLRAALALAHNGDSVDLTMLTCGKISLETGTLNIAVENLTLRGPGADRLTIAGSQVDHSYSVLLHSGYGTLRIDALRVTDNHSGYRFGPPASSCIASYGSVYLNRSTVTACSQGGVNARKGFSSRDSTISDSYQGVITWGGNVSINSSTISGNSGSECVGLRLGPFDGQPTTATVLISNSTISGNIAYQYAGGGGAGCIFAPTVISNSTIAFNWGRNGGGLVMRADVTVQSSIIANNTGYSKWYLKDPQDNLRLVGGSTVQGSNNIILNPSVNGIGIIVDPQLLPLADNGGPTMTHALGVGSPAIDAGSNPSGLTTDQRGEPFARIVGAAPDIGAFESRSPAVYIDGSFTGSWFDPSQSGHGLMLEVLPDHRLLALWFAFNPEGTQQSWFGGVGTYNGDTAVITDVALPTGGSWWNFDPNKILRNPWGRLTFTFADHDHGKVSFNSVLGYGTGSMNLLRLTNVAEKNPALATPIGSPGAVTTDATGNVYFSSDPNLIFKLDKQGKLTRIAGSGTPGYSGDGGPATQAQLNFPLSYPELLNDPVNFSPLVGGLAVDHIGNVYIADAYNNRVRRIDSNGIIGTVVGTGNAANAGDGGLAAKAAIHWPQGVAVDSAGNLYVSTVYASLRKIGSDGRISSLAGDNCGSGYLGPGLCAPEQIAIDAANNIFVPDGYCRVREVRHDGSIITVAGADTVPSNGSAFTCGYSGDGGLATKAALSSPYAVAVDTASNFYIADTGNNCIRKVNSAGIITTVAGVCNPSSSQANYSGDGGPATAARLNGPRGVAVDDAGNIFTADTNNHRIRKVAADGIITTIAGNGENLLAQTGEAGWVPTGNLITPRYHHTATLLQNGKVLIVGGGGGGYNSAELYDPATHTWSQTPPLSHHTEDVTATLLPDGKVLVAGGRESDSGTLAELYDPVSSTWSDTGSPIANLHPRTATLLQDGKVLFAGGYEDHGDETLSTPGEAELYDPATGKWSLTGSLNVGRWGSTMTLLQDGRVLIAGGAYAVDDRYISLVLNSAELYNPATGKWSATGTMKASRYDHRAILLRNGKVLVRGGGGQGEGSVDAAELYDPGTGTWSFAGAGTATPNPTSAHLYGTLTLLPDGKALAVGGYVSNFLPDSVVLSTDSAELYDPERGTWTSARNPNIARFSHSATLLQNGEVLIAGGLSSSSLPNSNYLSTAELYVPSAPPVRIDPSFTGSWFDPTQSGHGLMLEVLSDNRLLALWFAFSPEGNQQSWFGGVGTYSGNTATISDVALPIGGRWIPNFDPNAVVREPWGTLTFNFTDCNHGLVEFNSPVPGYIAGSMNLLRLTQPEGLTCP